MISGEQIKDLGERIGAATGYDREINFDLFNWLYLGRFSGMRGRGHGGGLQYEVREDDRKIIKWSGAGYPMEPPNYTASLDAILGLALAIFPNWTWSVSQNSGEKPEAWLGSPTGNGLLRENNGQGSAPTPALALCAALIDLLDARSLLKSTQPVDE